jgi:hypothetical protein
MSIHCHGNCYVRPLGITGVRKGEAAVDLTIWLPAMMLLGLVVFGLMFSFVVVCDKV